ncbi:MAG TPA: DUF962 domain-containing protein [Rhizomicrobium sp.]|nr:DUF962 domain-containing protein [Rhizomicrobium sp.]
MSEAGSARKTNRPIERYGDFWPYYLQEHAAPGTRAIHYFGTLLSTSLVAIAILTRNGWFALAALAGGYGPAWIGHFFIERNRPATFRYPLWSLMSDYRMTWRWMSGKLGRDLVRAGVETGRASTLR